MKNIFVSYCIFKILSIYLPALGPHCRTQLSLAAANAGYSSLQCSGFSLWRLLLLQSTDSRHLGFGRCSTQARWLQWVALGCECFRTCGTWALFLHGIRNLPRQGFELNLCPLHWQADFYPLCHKGSPAIVFYSNYRENTKLSLP